MNFDSLREDASDAGGIVGGFCIGENIDRASILRFIDAIRRRHREQPFTVPFEEDGSGYALSPEVPGDRFCPISAETKVVRADPTVSVPRSIA